MFKLRTTIFLALLLGGSGAFAEMIFIGLPKTKVMAEPGGGETVELAEADRRKNVVVIERCGDDLCWATRGNEILVRRVSGIYDIYVAVSGAGYIKIENPLDASSSPTFFEHVHIGLGTITYFGEAVSYEP